MEAQYLLLTCPKYLLHMIPLVPTIGPRSRILVSHMPFQLYSYLDLSNEIALGRSYSLEVSEDSKEVFYIWRALHRPFLMPDKCLVELSEFDFDSIHQEISFEMRRINEQNQHGEHDS